MTYCGLDFGTSNSTIGVRTGDAPTLVTVDGSNVVPSAMFFGHDGSVLYGKRAIAAYVNGEDGRLMRSLKSILGSRLIDETTMINRRRVSFRDIIASYVRFLKTVAEERLGAAITDAVLGRPVHYVDDDPDADRYAEETMRDIALSAGFENVRFEYEPVAAVKYYQARSGSNETLLVADLGGGTADFSVVRLGAAGAEPVDILRNSGVHIGGTDFDRRVNLDFFMPLLGYNSQMSDSFATKTLTVPRWYFHDMATWQRIHAMYDAKIVRDLEEIHRLSKDPGKIDRFLALLDARDGHRLAGLAEDTKIALSSAGETVADLSFIETDLQVTVSDEAFRTSAEQMTRAIVDSAHACVRDAGLDDGHINTIMMTGGTSHIPSVREAFLRRFGKARIVESDLFGSVGSGLTAIAGEMYEACA